VQDRGREATDSILTRLTEYVYVHFEAERRLMLRTKFPAEQMSRHLGQHEDLTSRTVDMVRAHHAGELTTILPLALFLQEWLGEHIRKSDRVLVAHVRAAGESF
jgi:hemerythrin